MREIKFRAWEKNLKEMIPIHSINFESKMVNTECAWRLFDEVELMQFTGLQDKNGKEIYEGDIIFIYDDEETESGWWENIIFHQGAFMAGDENLLANVHFRSKVVGNKYIGTET